MDTIHVYIIYTIYEELVKSIETNPFELRIPGIQYHATNSKMFIITDGISLMRTHSNK